MRKAQKVTLIFKDGSRRTFDSLTKAYLSTGISPVLLKKLARVGYGKPYHGRERCEVIMETE